MTAKHITRKKLWWNNSGKLLFSVLFVFSFAQARAQSKHTPGADTLILLENNSTCSLYVGFYLDYDEVEFLYDLKIDSACGITDYSLQLYDRWGILKGEIKETHLAYAVGYSHDPYNGAKEFYFVFTYKDKDGVKKRCQGFVKDMWW
jgi:hypothetical protein